MKHTILFALLGLAAQSALASEVYVAHKVFSIGDFLTEKGKETDYDGLIEVTYTATIDPQAIDPSKFLFSEVTKCVVWSVPPRSQDDDGVCARFESLGWTIYAADVDNVEFGSYTYVVKDLTSGKVIANQTGRLEAGFTGTSNVRYPKPELPSAFAYEIPVSVSAHPLNAAFGKFTAGQDYALKLSMRVHPILGQIRFNYKDGKSVAPTWAIAPKDIAAYWDVKIGVQGPFVEPVDWIKLAECNAVDLRANIKLRRQ